MRTWQCLVRVLPSNLIRMLAAFLVLLGASTLAMAQSIPVAERAVLVNLYNSTNGPNWNDSTNWLGGAGTECTWTGVTCDDTGSNVIGISLSDNNLVGTLPGLSGLTLLQSFAANSDFPGANQLSGPIPDLSALTALQDFEVNGNQLTGSIPNFDTLTQLSFFSATNNQLTGSIPSFANVSQLSFFSVSNNQLSGPIPALSAQGLLQVFEADDNALSGSIPDLSALVSLARFTVVDNLLTGSIPDLSRLSAMQYFDVASNQLTGSIPALDALTRAFFFSVSNNQLTGPIPSLSALVTIQTFSVDGNQLTGSIPALSNLSAAFQFNFSSNQLTGPIPSLSSLPNLQFFYARDNQLSGPIPGLSANGALHEFVVAANQLTGSIPSLTGLTVLSSFVVDGNQLTGSIPSLSGLTALQAFFAGSNQLTGSIPALSGLAALQNFDVFDNQLSGSIPSLSGLGALQFFVVSNNQLTGAIPSLSGLTALQSFNADANQLSGSIPSLSGLSALVGLTVSNNQLTGSLPSLSGLGALQTFVVATNQLSGTVPSLSGLTALQNFQVNGNQLSGSIPSLAGLASLKVVDVAGNQLTGSIPSLSGLATLQFIDLGSNQLSGSIPNLSGLAALQTFNAHGNRLTGSIPSLSGLTGLQSFGVDSNQLTGPIPSLSGLASLQLFDVAFNQLTGPVPSLNGLSSLFLLFLRDNQLNGPMALPPSPSALSPGLTSLCSNQLQSTGNPAADQAWDIAAGLTPVGGTPGWVACQSTRPTRLAVTSVNGGVNPVAGAGFSVVVQAQDGTGNPQNVVASTTVQLSRGAGTGALSGTLSCQINAGSNGCTVAGVTYSKAEPGVIITATAVSGDTLAAANSAAFTVNPANVAPAITSANNTAFKVGTAATFTVTATGTPAPTLSESGTLPSGVTFSAATGVLSGTPVAGTAGTYPITFTAANGVLPNATQSFTLTVNPANAAPAITSANTTAFKVGTAGTFTVSATGTPTPTLSENGSLPSGVTFNAATGVLSGTPAAGTAGAYLISFTAANGVLPNATQFFVLTVSPANAAPAITSANGTAFKIGTAGTFTVTATGTPAPSLSESGTLPSGVTFNAASGVLSGTPALGTAGTYPITFTAANGVLPNATQSFTLTVNPANVAPAITSASNTAFKVGTAGTFTVTATGTPAPTLSESGALPGGVTFNVATGVLSGTPAAGTAGAYLISFSAANGVLPNATQFFLLTVNPANAAPTITSANSTAFKVGTAGTFTVSAAGTPAPTLSESGSLPSGVTFNAATGVLGGTPAAGTAGTYPITFTAANGVLPNSTQSFTLTVSPANVAPAITSASNTAFKVGTAGTFTVTATGTPAPTLSESGALPSGVTFNAATGVLSGTAAAGTAGAYPITFTGANGVLPNATQSFTLTVNPANVAPAITSANSTAFKIGTAGTFTVTATGTPAPTLSESGALPSGVTFNAATGVLGGTPAAGTAGTYPITFTAASGVLPNATQSFTLTVNPANVAPVITNANSTAFKVGTAGTFTVTATGTPTPTLSESGTLPSGVTFNAATGVLGGTPAAGTASTYPITFTAVNGVLPNASQVFTLTVNPASVAPTITSAFGTTFTIGTAGSFTVTATGTPTPTLSESGTLPSGVTFNAATGALSGTPAIGSAGTYIVAFTANNGVVPAMTQSFTLTINPANVAPAITSSASATFKVGIAGTFTVTATGSPTPTLSESGTLPSGVTFNPGTGVLVGTPALGTAGSYPITFTATNGIVPNATQPFTLTVNSPTPVAYAYLRQFGSPGTGNGQFSFLTGVAIDPTSHHIFVVDNTRVQIFDSTGVYLSQFGPITAFQLGQVPQGIAVDPVSHNVVVVDQQARAAKIFSPTGTLLTQFGSQGSGNGQFLYPTGVAIDPTTRNVIVGSVLDGRVQIFNSTGSYLSQFLTRGTNVVGVSVDPVNHNIVVVDNFLNVEIFDSAGTYLRTIGAFNAPEGVAIDPTSENVVVADYANYRVQVLDTGGDFLGQFGSFGTGNGQFSGTFGGPIALAIDPTSHNVVVADIGGNRIEIFTPTTVSLAPNAVAFGNAAVGVASAVTPVTLTNIGTTPLTLFNITIVGANTGDFGQTNTCGGSVGPGASCTINVKFTPSAAGSRSASIQITDDAAGSPRTVPLLGTGVAAVQLGGNLPLGGFNFVDGAGNLTVALKVTNQGSSTVNSLTVNVSGTSVSGTLFGGAPFLFPLSAPVTLAADLAPGASETFQLVFSDNRPCQPSGAMTVHGTYVAGAQNGTWTMSFRTITIAATCG